MVSDGWHCSVGGSLPDLSLPPAPLLVVSQEDQQGWDQAPEAQGNNEQSWARDKFLGSQQRDKKIVEKIMVSVGVTMNIVKMLNPTILRPEIMVTLSRQCCRVPSADNEDNKKTW